MSELTAFRDFNKRIFVEAEHKSIIEWLMLRQRTLLLHFTIVSKRLQWQGSKIGPEDNTNMTSSLVQQLALSF